MSVRLLTARRGVTGDLPAKIGTMKIGNTASAVEKEIR
jgi:hypothetical protein